ncbi:rho/rac/cdc gtpase-activating protein [Anaeramoeba flamelloides]|uniref:Rho/rac/cdc gtpase-activating protein n=1 Tax=Anaeramoeba flamelloides TaxID=1746091 RepID=A0AAV7ZLN8_9EUKA|nr:rho/rac/cdc gtpase-activating protein [Anaeramoeba flamelloides]
MAATLVLKVVFSFSEHTTLVKFTPNTTVRESVEAICVKNNKDQVESFGLYCPDQEGFWLDGDRTLMSYEPWKIKKIEFKKKELRNVSFIYRGERFSVPIDETTQIIQLLPIIAKGCKTPNYADHIITYNNTPLDLNQNFIKQGFTDLSQIEFIFKYELFVKHVQQNTSTMKKHKKLEIPEFPIFEQHLVNSLFRGSKPLTVPTIITKTIKFVEECGLDEEGIYRISGNMNNITVLKDLFNQKDDVDLHQYINSPHDATGVFKLYLRNLPEPPLTFDLYEKFVQADQIKFVWEKAKKIKTLIQCLPTPYFDTMSLISRHMKLVSTYSKKNHMQMHNLAMLIGPNLLRSPDSGMSSVINDTQHQYSICRLIFEEYEYFFDGKEKSFLPLFAIGLFEYEANDESEIRVKKGQYYEVISQNLEEGQENQETQEASWWTVKNILTKEQGFVPSSYVELKEQGFCPLIKENQSTQKRSKVRQQLDNLNHQIESNILDVERISLQNDNLQNRISQIEDRLNKQIELRKLLELSFKQKYPNKFEEN